MRRSRPRARHQAQTHDGQRGALQPAGAAVAHHRSHAAKPHVHELRSGAFAKTSRRRVMSHPLPLFRSAPPRARRAALVLSSLSELQALGMRWLDPDGPGLEPRWRRRTLRSQGRHARRRDRDGADLHARVGRSPFVARVGDQRETATLLRRTASRSPRSTFRSSRSSTRCRPPTAFRTGKSRRCTRATCSRRPCSRPARATETARRRASSARSANRSPKKRTIAEKTPAHARRGGDARPSSSTA